MLWFVGIELIEVLCKVILEMKIVVYMVEGDDEFVCNVLVVGVVVFVFKEVLFVDFV